MTTLQKPRRVRALKTLYLDHVIRKEGDEFMFSGEPNAELFLELEAGDTSPVTSNVPRKGTESDKVDDLL